MTPSHVAFTLNGAAVTVEADGCSLLEALRDRLGVRSPKDGCAPQGQCGCCTVWVDGQPRVACVTPVARVAGRAVTTVEGLADAEDWGSRLCAAGGSQCGFCTPGIVMRLAAMAPPARTDAAVRQSLLAHLCRCTGWNTVVEAAVGEPRVAVGRDLGAAAARAALEGGVPQSVSPAVALGRGGFAADTAPLDALIAMRREDGEWVVAPTLTEARRAAGKVQGRRTTEPVSWPIELPAGDWVRTLQTTWVEPAYLEPDAAWCLPGGEPVGPMTNGGAFGGKTAAPGSAPAEVAVAARRLADEHGRAVLAMYSREDVVRLGPKRPPIAAGVRADGTGIIRVARTPGIAAAIASVAPGLLVEEVHVAGPPTSALVRAAGWAEAAALLAGDDGWVTAPNGARAQAALADGVLQVTVACGEVLDEVVLRSYCIGAAHMALGWVRHEAIVVGADGVPLDLTIRSFGVLRAVYTPSIEVTILPPGSPDAFDSALPVNGSDAVFAAVAAAVWRADGYSTHWPNALEAGRLPTTTGVGPA